MRLLRSSILSMLLAVAAGGAAGQQVQIQTPYRFVDENQGGGFWAGYVAASDGTVGFGPKSGPVIGGRWSIRLSGPFTIEVEPGYFKSTRAVRDTLMVDSARRVVGEADVALLLLNGSLRFNLTGPRTWHGLQPFVAFGAGASLDLAGEGGADEDVAPDVRFDFGTSFAGQLGGGIEWYASRRLTVRFDARNVLWKLKTPAPFLISDPLGTTPESEWAQNALLSIGVSLRF